MNGVERSRGMVMILALSVGACGGETTSESTPEVAAEEPAPPAPAPAKSAAVAEPPAPAEPEEPPPSGHAVARVGALLFTSSTGSLGFEVPALGEGPEAPVGITVNVVGRKDDRVEVETLVDQSDDHHCAAALSGLEKFRLRLYVEEADLLPVLVEEFSEEFEDGTKIRLAKGVPVPEGGEAHAAGATVAAKIPAESLGRYYEPGKAFADETPTGQLHPMEGHPLHYDGEHVLAEGTLYREAGTLAYFRQTPGAGKVAIEVRNPCLTATVLASAERHASAGPPVEVMGRTSTGILGKMDAESGHFLASPYGAAFAVGNDDEDVWGGLTGTEVGEAYGVGGLGLVGTGRGETVEYTVKAGVAVLWADGSPAGQVTADTTFESSPRDQSGNSCFDVPLTTKSEPTMPLCFAPADVAEERTAGSMGTIGLGSTGLIGKGGGGGTGSGYGRGSGAGFGGRGKRIPRVRQAKAAVKGSLDKDIIRRIVRAHINEVRSCYNRGLAKDPSLEGKVSVQFTIGPTGKVPVAVVSKETLGDDEVANCIAKAVKRWKFPKPPGGGNVVVTYPFVLSPG